MHCKKVINTQKTAFTLAEVLITLLIIGVVASLVIPAIINDTQKEEFYTLFKKDYSAISDATKMMIIDNGGTLAGFFSDQNDLTNDFGNYVSFQKKCLSGIQGCFYSGTNTWKTLYGDDGWYSHPTYSSAIMNNGGLISFRYTDSDCEQNNGSGSPAEHSCGWMEIDVNGFKEPNILGRDIFVLWITKTGIFPFGGVNASYSSSNYCNKNFSDVFSGRGCAAKVLKGESIP